MTAGTLPDPPRVDDTGLWRRPADVSPGGHEVRSIGIAIGIPEPFGSELQGWRQRLGDPNADRIVPHVTLVPPTSIPTVELAEVEEHLRVVASETRPFDIRLRGASTFMPVSPVVFVPLVQGIVECELLASMIRTGPFAVDLSYPYHPHVTVAHDLPADQLVDAYAAVSSYEAAFWVWGFTLFEQGGDLRWRPQRDFAFGAVGLPGPPERPSSHGRSEGW